MSNIWGINILSIPHKFFVEDITHKGYVKFSRCIVPVGLILKNLTNTKNKFVMCPIYSKIINGKEVVVDIQIGVTGKAKFKEPQLMAVNREIGEELGMVLPYENLSQINCLDPPAKTMFWIDASNVVSSDTQIEKSIDTPWKNSLDNKDKRVCICIVADLHEVTRLFESPNFMHRYSDHETDIAGVCAVPIDTALQYIVNKQRRSFKN